MKIIGLDVSKDNVCAHALDRYPAGGLSTYWQKTRKRAKSEYPTFYSVPHPKKKRKSAWDFLEWVKDVKPHYAVMEPTGHHYSLLWATILQSLNIPVLWVGHIELKRYREGKNLPGKGKNDAIDALAMAAYPHDPEHLLESEEFNPRAFLMVRCDRVNRLRELCQDLNHLARVQHPIVAHLKQCLSWQFPEVQQLRSQSSKYAPPLYGWLANREDLCSRRGWTRIVKKHERSIARELDLEISPLTRLQAQWMIDIDEQEKQIECELRALLDAEEFAPYNQIFDRFGFGLRIRSRLLSRIYPFESFLTADNRQWIEYELREVKKPERVFTGGVYKVKFNPGDMKRHKRNRSRDIFKMRLGMGTVLEASGDGWIEKSAGSTICRESLWQHVFTKVEPDRGPDTPEFRELVNYRDDLKERKDPSGKPLLNGRHIEGKIMSKTTNLLFKVFVQTFARQ
ncbi:MAG: transposase [Cyanobacteria bacterium P01_E01_bin.42]